MAAVAVQPVVVVLTVGSEFLSWNDYFFNLNNDGYIGDLENNVNWNGGIFTPFQIYNENFIVDYGTNGCFHVGDQFYLLEMLVVGYNVSARGSAQRYWILQATFGKKWSTYNNQTPTGVGKKHLGLE